MVIENVISAFGDVIELRNLLMTIGVTAGPIAGSIPGFTITMAVVSHLPFTFGLSAVEGLATMIGVFVGGLSGGLMSGMLTGIPEHRPRLRPRSTVSVGAFGNLGSRQESGFGPASSAASPAPFSWSHSPRASRQSVWSSGLGTTLPWSCSR